jgi:hypothetical protein
LSQNLKYASAGITLAALNNGLAIIISGDSHTMRAETQEKEDEEAQAEEAKEEDEAQEEISVFLIVI